MAAAIILLHKEEDAAKKKIPVQSKPQERVSVYEDLKGEDPT